MKYNYFPAMLLLNKKYLNDVAYYEKVYHKSSKIPISEQRHCTPVKCIFYNATKMNGLELNSVLVFILQSGNKLLHY